MKYNLLILIISLILIVSAAEDVVDKAKTAVSTAASTAVSTAASTAASTASSLAATGGDLGSTSVAKTADKILEETLVLKGDFTGTDTTD
jgi:hypothetical protein